MQPALSASVIRGYLVTVSCIYLRNPEPLQCPGTCGRLAMRRGRRSTVHGRRRRVAACDDRRRGLRNPDRRHVAGGASQATRTMRPLIGPCLREYAGSVAVPLATSVAMAVVVMLVPRLVHGSPLLVLTIQIAIGAAFYIATSAALRRIKLIPLLDNLIVTRS
jgi:hypothetical protein